MDSNKIKVIIFGVVSTFIALYLGISAATAQFEVVAWIVGTGVLLGCVLLGRKIWLIIPFLGALNLTLSLPGGPTTLLIAQFLYVGFSILLLLMRKLPWRMAFTEMEFWILALTIMVGQVYMRNPVGLNLFGGVTVGGKAYYVVGISLLTAIFLSGLRVPENELKAVLRLTIVGGILNLMLGVVGMISPSIGRWYGVGSMGSDDTKTQDESGIGLSQNQYLGTTGTTLALWISTFISPLKACFRFRWGLLLLVACAMGAVSGYRNAMGSLGLTLLVGIWYRGGFSSLLASALVGGMGVALLAAVNSAMPLPGTVQRSLAFLPGTWEQRYLDSTANSTEWRVEIWKEVLLTDRWIHNKWFGVGLGFTAQELAMQRNLGAKNAGARFGVSGFDSHRETILANGDYHSGPVQTIRTIGYVGLFFLLLAQIRLAVHAHRQIQRCRNTEWFPLALIIGIPLVWAPIFFVFIFGTFKDGASTLIMGYGMIRLLENNLPLPAYMKRRKFEHLMPSNRPLPAQLAMAKR